jgi:hypothetical protein
MAETPAPGPPGYSRLLGELKQRIQATQSRASLAVKRHSPGPARVRFRSELRLLGPGVWED